MVSVCYFYSVQLKHDLLYDNSTECFWIMLIQDLEYHNFHFHSIRRQRKLRTINHLIIINQRKYWTKNLLNHFAGGRDFFPTSLFSGRFCYVITTEETGSLSFLLYMSELIRHEWNPLNWIFRGALRYYFIKMLVNASAILQHTTLFCISWVVCIETRKLLLQISHFWQATTCIDLNHEITWNRYEISWLRQIWAVWWNLSWQQKKYDEEADQQTEFFHFHVNCYHFCSFWNRPNWSQACGLLWLYYMMFASDHFLTDYDRLTTFFFVLHTEYSIKVRYVYFNRLTNAPSSDIWIEAESRCHNVPNEFTLYLLDFSVSSEHFTCKTERT